MGVFIVAVVFHLNSQEGLKRENIQSDFVFSFSDSWNWARDSLL